MASTLTSSKDPVSSTASEFKCLEPEEYFRQHVNRGVRPDGRENLLELRPVSLSVDTLKSADASAVVKQGNTTVVCGIKLEMAPTKAEEPDKGRNYRNF